MGGGYRRGWGGGLREVGWGGGPSGAIWGVGGGVHRLPLPPAAFATSLLVILDPNTHSDPSLV